MTWFASFGNWQWSVLATVGGATIAFAFAASEAEVSSQPASAEQTAAAPAAPRDPSDAIVIAKHARRGVPASAYAAARPAAPAVVTHAPKAAPPAAPAAPPPAPIAAAPAPKPALAPAPPPAPAPASVARVSSADMQEAASLLARARGESSL